MPEDDKITKEYLEGIHKDVSEVGELLKSAPTKEQLEAFKTETDVAEIVKAAVAEAIAPLTARIAELEDSPVVKGMQDFDLAAFQKAAAVKADEPEGPTDIMKGVIYASYPEINRGG